MEYIIYVRKSTDENSEHQKQSIPDQIVKCVEYAQNNNLFIKIKNTDFKAFEWKNDMKIENTDDDNIWVYKKFSHLFIVKERESAKEPYKRPKWRKIIEWIKKWKIKWIISYSPDRQARNLLEAWEIIDLVDKWLVDLKYTNFHFEPNASWKMMLWIWFVFSKQYSDKLSEDVTRWTLSKLEKWYALWTYKWWYIVNEKGFHEIDEINFYLLKKAFELKIYENKTNAYIAKWLNKVWFYRIWKNWKQFKVTERWLQDIFRDTFYYWIFKHSWREIDLRKINKYFKPLISYEEYILLQNKIINKKDVNKEIWKLYKEIEPFSLWFIRTEDDYKCSFYISHSKIWKEKLISMNKKSFKEINIPTWYFYYNISRKSKIRKNITTIKAVTIAEKIKEKLCTFNFNKNLLEKLFIKGEQKIYQTIESKNIKKNYLKKELEEYEKKLKNLILENDYKNITNIELEIINKEKMNLIKKISSIKEEINNISLNERNYILEYKIIWNIWYFISNYKDFLSFCRYFKFFEIFTSTIIIKANSLYISLFQEIEQILMLLVDYYDDIPNLSDEFKKHTHNLCNFILLSDDNYLNHLDKVYNKLIKTDI